MNDSADKMEWCLIKKTKILKNLHYCLKFQKNIRTVQLYEQAARAIDRPQLPMGSDMKYRNRKLA